MRMFQKCDIDQQYAVMLPMLSWQTSNCLCELLFFISSAYLVLEHGTKVDALGKH